MGDFGVNVEKNRETIGQNLPSGRKLITVKGWGLGIAAFYIYARIPSFEWVQS
jgi:hypothetical protein